MLIRAVLAVYLLCIAGAALTVPGWQALPYGAFSWAGGCACALLVQHAVTRRRDG